MKDMGKIVLRLLLLLLPFNSLYAQSDVQQRILLIGDAGEINPTQSKIIKEAIGQSLSGKTTVLFLGDNIYPKGFELDGDKKQNSEAILRSQFEGFRKMGIPVYFVPGNHDWDKSGPDGFKKIAAANEFINSFQDSLLQIIPKDACPGPYQLTISSNLIIVAMDSEWWLYPFDTHTSQSDCECKTKRDVIGKLEDIIEHNKNKTIIFATHHPFATYGSHGGYYNLKEHIFPLTELNKHLYIPLPLVGSLYPLLRKTFPPPEDVANALYKDMRQSIAAILKKHPNVIHVSGHEHSLQLIQGELLQVVSGAGSKHTLVKNGKGSIYAASKNGYVIADLLTDNSNRLSYFVYDNDSVRPSFVYNRPMVAPLQPTDLPTEPIFADSIKRSLVASFDKVSNTHRNLFGENYRKVWALNATLPVLHISKEGLTPTEMGGGMQTRSLRLKKADGKEWVVRSLDKYPDALLPSALSQTWASVILHDNVSANFPYSPLVVPVIANSLGVPHSNPSIVYIAPDPALGIYSRGFANTLAVFEEREPLGKSLSTIKMEQQLKEDNDNAVDQHAFLTARIQDIFLGDWDRHGDQWRWVAEKKGKTKTFRPIPRDRDQVFYVNQGLFPKILSLPWILPKFQGFGPRIKNVNGLAFNARLLDGIYTNSLSYNDWVMATKQAVNKLTDSVIQTALKRMPATVYKETQSKLATQLKGRRQDLNRAMPIYYRFINKNIDLTLSDKNEKIIVSDTLDGKLNVSVYKLKKENETGKLVYQRILDPAVTDELRLYTRGGEDQIKINNSSSPIRLRIVGDGISSKHYSFKGTSHFLRKVHVYEGDSNAVFSDYYKPVRLHLSSRTSNTEFQPTNRYNNTAPLLWMGYNVDDGFLLGAGLKWIKQGFRKQPYASMQQFILAHSFSSDAFRATYDGEWLHLINKADLVLHANAFVPSAQNYFGRGNASVFNQTGGDESIRFYRTRFNMYNATAALRWRGAKRNSFSIGPSLQYYSYDEGKNQNRFITNVSALNSYDSATIAKEKIHAGIVANFTLDTRNNNVIPSMGVYFNLRAQGYTGLNTYSKDFVQLIGQLAFYKSLDRKSSVILANQIGGGVSYGNSTFYQSLFLGGHANLRGFRQFRFAGDHTAYSNTELRIKLSNIASYVLPGQLGLVAFFDVGKVWQENANSNTWHVATGGGFYFAPAQLFIAQVVIAKSVEGWYPYITGGFRF
jgi:hypothetical protein